MALTPIASVAPTCAISYFVTPDRKIWDEGMAICNSLAEGSTLANPRSAAENAAVELMRKGTGESDLYIGHHEHDDADGNRKWAWFDGSDLAYDNWAVGEPNNDAGAGRDCGTIEGRGG